MEKNVCNLPTVFAEVLKDEINANDEQRLYNGIKRVMRKYSQDKKGLEVLDEIMRVICGGASLYEILQITKEESMNPTLATDITVDSSCKVDNITH